MSNTAGRPRADARHLLAIDPILQAAARPIVIVMIAAMIVGDAQANDIFGFPCDPNAGLITKIGFFIQGVVIAGVAVIAFVVVHAIFRQFSRDGDAAGQFVPEEVGQFLFFGLGAIVCALGGVFFASSQCTSSAALTPVPMEEQIAELIATGAGLLGVVLILTAIVWRRDRFPVWGFVLLVGSAAALFVITVIKQDRYMLSEEGFRATIAKVKSNGGRECSTFPNPSSLDYWIALAAADYDHSREIVSMRQKHRATIIAIREKGGFYRDGRAYKILCCTYTAEHCSGNVRTIQHPRDHKPDYPRLD